MSEDGARRKTEPPEISGVRSSQNVLSFFSLTVVDACLLFLDSSAREVRLGRRRGGGAQAAAFFFPARWPPRVPRARRRGPAACVPCNSERERAATVASRHLFGVGWGNTPRVFQRESPRVISPKGRAFSGTRASWFAQRGGRANVRATSQRAWDSVGFEGPGPAIWLKRSAVRGVSHERDTHDAFSKKTRLKSRYCGWGGLDTCGRRGLCV